MSLINEALRKAQNQRKQAPGLGDETHMGHQPANYADPPNRFGLMVVLGLCSIILLGFVVGLTIVVMSKYAPKTVQQPTPPKTENLPAPQTTSPMETARIDQTFIQPVEPLPESASTIAPEATPQIPKNVEVPLDKTIAETIEAPAPEPEPMPNQEISKWLEQSKISGVRITRSSSKVILNNKAFVKGDHVNLSLGLSVLEIEPERIIFIDANGVEYLKLF